jgi:hypothetical protein
MYSPKIREDLIPRIYEAAKNTGLAMTDWVNQAVERALNHRPEPQQPRKENDSYEHKRP